MVSPTHGVPQRWSSQTERHVTHAGYKGCHHVSSKNVTRTFDNRFRTGRQVFLETSAERHYYERL